MERSSPTSPTGRISGCLRDSLGCSLSVPEQPSIPRHSRTTAAYRSRWSFQEVQTRRLWLCLLFIFHEVHARPGGGLSGGLATLRERLSIDTEELADTLMTPGHVKPPVVLIHGAVQGGWVWEFAQPDMGAPGGVKALLEDAGYTVYNPTLPFHYPNAGWNYSDGTIDANLYVDTIVQVIQENSLQNITIVGHSLAGVWLQLVLQKIPSLIGRMLFLDAVILMPQESFFSNAIAGAQAPAAASFPAQAFFTVLFSYPFFSQQCSMNVWRDILVNTRRDDTAFVQETYSQLVPEPHGPEYQPMDTSAFFRMPTPKAFLWATQDISLGGDPAQWRQFADRLQTADNGQYSFVMYNVTADHQSMLTNPAGLASSILQAAAALGG